MLKMMDRHETAVELTYRAQVFPWLAIQPGVQTIFNPGLILIAVFAEISDKFLVLFSGVLLIKGTISVNY